MTGRVQGVGFRWWVRRHADGLGLTGWVMNDHDERAVELVAEGAVDALDELERLIGRDRRSGRRGVERRREPASGEFDGFESFARELARDLLRHAGCGVFASWDSSRSARRAAARCPSTLEYTDGAYEPVGSPGDAPDLEGVEASLEPGFRTTVGFSSWTVWVDPADAPTASSAPLPDLMVLECGDGTFQAYRRGGA